MNFPDKITAKPTRLLILTIIGLIIFAAVATHSKQENGKQKQDDTSENTLSSMDCLDGLFDGPTDTLKTHSINLDFTGRIAVGDLNADNHLDFVVSNRDRLAAYDLCGNQLWQADADTNWDYPAHVYWNWTSYGYIGDADGDGNGEFLHIGSDWRTLYVRNGLSGEIKHEIDLGTETNWMYVLLGHRGEKADDPPTRIFVTGRPGHNRIKAIDIRSGNPEIEWVFITRIIQNAYMPPIAVNLDQTGGDEIVHSTVAVDENGALIWRYSFNDFSVLGAAHTLTVRDIDPDLPGHEAVYSIYGPKRGAPSLIGLSSSDPNSISWQAYSPHRERHPHQHSVGDFDVNTPGLEVLARNNDAKNHWLIDAKGKLIHEKVRLNQSSFPSGWYSGELVQSIEWDETPGTEVLYTERHVSFREVPRLVITSSTPPVAAKTPFFHGGIDITKIDNDKRLSNKPDPSRQSWFGYVDRPPRYNNDGPYEGAAHAIDIFGDGREEVLTWAAGKIMIYYNSGHADVGPRRNNPEYMKRKKIWTNVYNPR